MKKFLTFGEVLWDCFGDEKHIGGAPYNFAAHCALKGINSGLISAVGEDPLGKATLDCLKKCGVDINFMKIDKSHQTGRTDVTMNNGFPSYNVVTDVAYDHIELSDDDIVAIKNYSPDCFYFGNLIQRSEVSQVSLLRILEKVSIPTIFCDVNIRKDCFTDSSLSICFKYCNILKISREDIDYLKDFGFIPKDILDIYEIPPYFAKKYSQLKLIIVTMDSEGAFIYDCSEKEIINVKSIKTDVVSSVGAGDAFSAGFISSYLNGGDHKNSLDEATKLASYVLKFKEAVPGI